MFPVIFFILPTVIFPYTVKFVSVKVGYEYFVAVPKATLSLNVATPVKVGEVVEA